MKLCDTRMPKRVNNPFEVSNTNVNLLETTGALGEALGWRHEGNLQQQAQIVVLRSP